MGGLVFADSLLFSCLRYFYRTCQGTLFPNPVHVGRQLDKLPMDMRRIFLSQSQMKLSTLGSLFPPRAPFFPLCRPFQKDYRPRLKQTRMSSTKQKEKAISSPIPSKSMEVRDTPLSSKNCDDHITLNFRVQEKVQSCRQGSNGPLSENLHCMKEPLSAATGTLPYTKDTPASRTILDSTGLEAALSPTDVCPVGLLTFTPLLPQTETMQLTTPPSFFLGQKLEDEDHSNQKSLLKQAGDVDHNQSASCLQEHSLKTTFLWCFLPVTLIQICTLALRNVIIYSILFYEDIGRYYIYIDIYFRCIRCIFLF